MTELEQLNVAVAKALGYTAECRERYGIKATGWCIFCNGNRSTYPEPTEELAWSRIARSHDYTTGARILEVQAAMLERFDALFSHKWDTVPFRCMVHLNGTRRAIGSGESYGIALCRAFVAAIKSHEAASGR